MSFFKSDHRCTTILVVDDEPWMRDLLENALQGVGGYNVVCAEDGREALSVFDDHMVDLVITDLHMANMTGLQLIQQLVSRDGDIPIIAMSGGGFQNDDGLSQALELGAHASLAKPFTIQALLEIVDECLPT